MNLKQVRIKFRDLSGRHDLVTEDGADVGANFFIQEGMKYLDRLVETQKSYAEFHKILAVGGWNIQMPQCRAIKEVWAASTTLKWQLDKMDLQDLIAGLMPSLVSQLDQGTTLYYSPTLVRVVGDIPVTISNFVDVITPTGEGYNAVLVLPPPDENLLITVKGIFYFDDIVEDTDENFWTVVHPSILVKAALREIEVFNQNQTKIRMWDAVLAADITGINKDLVEEEIAERDQMEG